MDSASVLNRFHPVIKEWFTRHIGTPSLPQVLGWPEIQSGKNVLISAPTGAGKTLAAFLECIDHLLKKGLEGSLPEGVFLLYVSPLKALNNDIYKNLDIPLEGIKKQCIDLGIPFPDIQKSVRTGDTPQAERQRMVKNPPHILITTPESLYLMLTSKKASGFLKKVRYLIVDEIHTMLGTKRGVHMGLSIERLEHLTEHELVRIGLSATVNPIGAAADYLGGYKRIGQRYEKRPVTIVAPAMERSKDLMIHMPLADYRMLEQGSIWPEIYDNVFKLVKQHTSTIVFVNNRAVAERVSANLNSMEDEEICRPHHGSLSKAKRLEVEDRFKNGQLKCMIATSTLELGIDIGSVDLMVQVASPLSVSSGLQRLGRAGHRLHATSKGRIIPKTRGDLIKSAFIAKEMLEGRIEQEKIPENCLDILSQHIVSMCCDGQWKEEEMLSIIRSAWSYRNLKETDFQRVLAMLAGDFEHLDDIPAKPRIQWDRQNRTVEGTPYSRMLAINSSGTIPDRGYFSVVLEDYKTRIGELDEVFVFEARLGDRFMLGNSAWKIVKIEKNRVIVTPCTSIGAKTPFWQGDGIGSPYEQGLLFGRFLKELSDRLETEEFIPYLTETAFLDETAALNIKNFLMDQQEAIGCLSHNRRVVVEYLRDDVSDQRIIIHAHFGGRVNSVLAILIQKALEDTIRCQAFASHSNDAILIHLYGCPDEISGILSLLKPADVENALLSMLPGTSRFAMTFRYNAYRSLMMGVRNLGQRLPLWIQRLRSVDALENARKFMDHPLIVETMRECLEEIFDIPNTIQVLKDIKSGNVEVVEKNTWFPSPFASELLFEFKFMMMYAEKAPHPGETKGPVISGLDALNLSYSRDEKAAPLNPEAIMAISLKNNVRHKLKEVASSNELHSFLLIYGDITQEEIPSVSVLEWLTSLLEEKRALCLNKGENSTKLYIAAEEAELYSCALALDRKAPDSDIILGKSSGTWTEDEAVGRVLRRFSRYHSPFAPEEIISRYGFTAKTVQQSLTKQISDGLLVKGHLRNPHQQEYCHLKVYEAIIRKDSSIKANEVVAQSPDAFASFMSNWQRLTQVTLNPEVSLYDSIKQLEGLYLPSDWWEAIVFPARVKGYSAIHLDRLCASGKIFWRVLPNNPDKSLKLAWYCTENLHPAQEFSTEPLTNLHEREEKVLSILKHKGACFTHVLTALTGIQSSELLDILEQLVYKGYVVNDSFMSIRYFMENTSSKGNTSERHAVYKARKIALAVSKTEMGRWELAWPVFENDLQILINRWFSRYGLLSRDTLAMEETPFSWNEIYEALKLQEYAGSVMRGYFIEGISGIQFMVPEAWQKLGTSHGIQVLNACDPAQVYGKLIPRNDGLLTFSNLPSTAVILYNGKPVIVLERFGEKITFTGTGEIISEALTAFKTAFLEKRLWPDQKKVVIKQWPDDPEQKEFIQAVLKDVGFKNEILKMVLWR